MQAFEAEAVDYLLKPFSAERLHAALARVRGPAADAVRLRCLFGRAGSVVGTMSTPAPHHRLLGELRAVLESAAFSASLTLTSIATVFLSHAIRSVIGWSKAFMWVRNGRAAAPPCSSCSTGVSISR